MNTSKNQYIKFCNSEKGLPIFFQHWYLDATCTPGCWDVMIIEKSGEIAAVLPYYKKSKLGFEYITMPSLSKFHGPYIIERYKNKTYSIYKEFISRIPKVALFFQNFHYNVQDWIPFYWEKFEQQTLYSHVLNNIQDLEKYYATIDRYYKKIIVAGNKNILLKNESNITDPYNISFELISKTYHRQKQKVPFSRELYTRLIEVLVKKKNGKIFFALDQYQNIIATAILIWDKNSSYYLISGDDPQYRSHSPGVYLIYSMIEYTSQKLDLNKMDFLGSMIPNLEIIRRKFRAEPQPYFEIKKNYSKAFKRISRLKNI